MCKFCKHYSVKDKEACENELAEAETRFIEACSAKSRVELIICCIRMAEIYRVLSPEPSREKAKEFEIKALALADSLHDNEPADMCDEALAKFYSALGSTYKKHNYVDKTITCFEKEFSLWKKLSESREDGNSLLHFADCYFKLAYLYGDVEYLYRSLSICEKLCVTYPDEAEYSDARDLVRKRIKRHFN